jgi:hypothetical protein
MSSPPYVLYQVTWLMSNPDSNFLNNQMNTFFLHYFSGILNMVYLFALLIFVRDGSLSWLNAKAIVFAEGKHILGREGCYVTSTKRRGKPRKLFY